MIATIKFKMLKQNSSNNVIGLERKYTLVKRCIDTNESKYEYWWLDNESNVLSKESFSSESEARKNIFNMYNNQDLIYMEFK